MSGLVESVVRFCRALRERGMLVTAAHAIDAVKALRIVGLEEKREVYYALRTVLTARPQDFDIFDELFEQLFARPEPPSRSRARKSQPKKGEPGAPALSSWGPPAAASEDDREEVPAASDHQTTAEKDFASFGAEDLEEIQRIAERIARRLAARPSRRWKPGRGGARIDLRRTLRNAKAGELIDLRRRKRKPRKVRIVALCDVSGSMDLYSRLLLQFLYALQGSVARVESFVFSTELRRVTEALRASDYASALRELPSQGFSGGTRIGECIAAFNEGYPHLVDRRTVVVVLSDGWDTGEPAILGAQLELLSRRGRKLVWLNPLLGSPGYEPLALGMQAALPHLSVFAPAHNLDSLRALERHLS